jgi:hypothetical protein
VSREMEALWMWSLIMRKWMRNEDDDDSMRIGFVALYLHATIFNSSLNL